MQSAAACVGTRHHEVEVKSDAERRKRLTRVRVSDTVEQRMISGGSNDERLT